MIHKLKSYLRLYGIEAWYSYRALFAWQSPGPYVSAKVIFPFFQLLLFLYMGRFAGMQDSLYIVIGNLLLLPSVNGVSGVSMTIGAERQFGTLPYLIGSPAPRAPLFLGRTLFHILDGLTTTLIAIPLAIIFFGVDFSRANLALIVVCILLLTLTSTGLGLVLGSVALTTREGWTITTVTYMLFYIFCGVNFPVSALPGALQWVSFALPITRGIQATRLVLAGANWSTIAPLVAGELVVGFLYAVLGYWLFRYVERRTTMSGQWDLI
ncbi:MAG: ABC transporter permease [Anaerolineaceae bacterium]|nr:ABC transporter permease [Anaerolineaceae bacterium]